MVHHAVMMQALTATVFAVASGYGLASLSSKAGGLALSQLRVKESMYTPVEKSKASTCMVRGDPHITNFDGAQVSLLVVTRAEQKRSVKGKASTGPMWLVRSSQVHIQALYLPDDALPDKNLYVRAVAVGGPFLGNRTLLVGSLGSTVTWEGHAILETPTALVDPSTAAASVSFVVPRLFNASQSPHGQLLVDLPLGVWLNVQRNQGYVDVAITMPRLEGSQDGLCGNFNGVAADDTLKLVEDRADPKVTLAESLF